MADGATLDGSALDGSDHTTSLALKETGTLHKVSRNSNHPCSRQWRGFRISKMVATWYSGTVRSS